MVGPWGSKTQSTNASSATPPTTTSISAQIAELRLHAGHAATPESKSAIQNTVPDADNGWSTPNTWARRYSVSADW